MSGNNFTPPLAARPAASAREFLDEWLTERGIEKEWGLFELVTPSAFLGEHNVPAFKIITHDVDGTPCPARSITRFDTRHNYCAKDADGKPIRYKTPYGVGAVIYAPQADSFKRWADSPEKWIAEGEGKALALIGVDKTVLGFRGVHAWHRKGETTLHPDLGARLRPSDRLLITIDGDWRTNPDVHRGAFRLMQAVRNCGAIPVLVDLPTVPGQPKLGIDDLIAVWRRNGNDVAAALAALPRLEEIPNPFVVDLKDLYATAQNFVAARYAHEEHGTLAHWQGEFYRWRGPGWERYAAELLREDLYAFVVGAGCVAKAHVITGIADALASVVQLRIPEAPAWLRPSGTLLTDVLAMRNGLLRLSDRTLLEPTPLYFNLNWSDVQYQPDVACPRWLRFLAETYPNDVEAQNCLQEYMGYSLTEDTSQQKAIALIGAKRSGKGTIARVLQTLVGRASCCAPTLQSLGENFGLQSWIGKKVAVVADARASARNNAQAMVERVLTITGEDTQFVDRKYLTPWEGRLRARLWLMSNTLPSTHDHGAAFASRFLILNHTVSFAGREDTNLEATLDAEAGGILLWALEGLTRLRTRGHFLQPASGQERVREWERMNSPIFAFVQDNCALGPDLFVPKKDMRIAFNCWLMEHGANHHVDDEHFTQELRAATQNAVRVGQRTIAGKAGVRVFCGVGLTHNTSNTSKNPIVSKY